MADRRSELPARAQEARLADAETIRVERTVSSISSPAGVPRFASRAGEGDGRPADAASHVRRTPEAVPSTPRPRIGEFRPGLDFVLGETLRRDPLGVTYRGRDVTGSRDVAVTLYQSAATPNPRAVERFQDAMLVAAVDHPVILSPERAGRWRGQVGVVRRLVYAPTLAEALPRGMRCELPRALEILRPIASALDAAHGVGVIHGDLRPEAILLTKSVGPLLVGCGVADGLDLNSLLIATLERRTEWGWSWLEAAAPYLAPELWRGGTPDARADQYALAVIAFRMLTGERPFVAEHVAQLAELHRISVIPRASILRPELPPSVDVAITRALAKVAAERFTTVTHFIDALAGQPPRGRILATDPARVASTPRTLPRATARPALVVGVIGALLLVASAVASLLLR